MTAVPYWRSSDGKVVHKLGCAALKTAKPYPWKWASKLDLAELTDVCSEMGIRTCKLCIGAALESA